jgi:GalNAc-alpha-(1->4)-GalNAc-alpha-(1->3)-diNAcBac-PP-undecaprenol alpha-1,4-N-acetyl-D-galactosaminyltransferase
LTLTCVISDLHAGGAERVLSILAGRWAEEGRRVVVLVLWGDGSVDTFFRLPSNVEVRHLGLERLRRSGAKLSMFRQLAGLRAAIADTAPDVVMALMDTVSVRTMLATRGLGVPVICVEHCDPATRPLRPFWEVSRRLTYPLADAVVTLSDDAMAFFPERIRRSGAVIPNPVLPAADRGVRLPAAPPTLVSLGRLSAVKQIDVLLRIFARLAERHPDWQLNIWGDGPERERLAALIESLGIGTQARLCGATDRPLEALRDGDLFVMTSRTEGFPMALAEAMASGIPAVSFDCPSGPRQLIRPEIDGVLVADGDEAAFEAAIERLMHDRSERLRFGANAREVVTRFSIDRVAAMWDELFVRVATPDRGSERTERTAA